MNLDEFVSMFLTQPIHCVHWDTCYFKAAEGSTFANFASSLPPLQTNYLYSRDYDHLQQHFQIGFANICPYGPPTHAHLCVNHITHELNNDDDDDDNNNKNKEGYCVYDIFKIFSQQIISDKLLLVLI